MDINDILKLLYGEQRQQNSAQMLQLAQNDRGQLLKDAEDAFYGGGAQGQVPQPQPTPRPSPTPRKGKDFQFTV